jgi:Dehydrogenases with different specificities (related to short-chain alcohol dehydrogenases)
MEISLEGKVIVVTGGTKGLGRAAVEATCKAGAKVILSGRDKNDAEEILKITKDKYNSNAIFVEGCLGDVNNCKILIEAAIKNFGKLDGLINYAGITSMGSILDTTEELFDNVFNINFKAAFFCSKFAIQEMIKNGGSIVNIGSTHAYGGDIERAAYGTSKGAMLALSKHIAKNYAKYQIRSNVITMGWVATPNEIKLTKSLGHDIEWLNKQGKETVPMGRLQVNEDYLAGILYLLSDFSSQLTASEIHINGGFWPYYG